MNQNEKIRKHLERLKDGKDEVERVVKAFTAPQLELRATLELAKKNGRITDLEYRKLYEDNVGLGQFIELPAALNVIIPLIKDLKSFTKGKVLDPSQKSLLSFIDMDVPHQVEDKIDLIELPRRRLCNVRVLDAYIVGSTTVNGFPKSFNVPKENRSDEEKR